MPRILFLSALDFKEKSIQVIRITPQSYARAGWDVHYIVARDNTKRGNYSYEPEISIPGVEVERFYWPLKRLRDLIQHRYLNLLSTKLAGLLVIVSLALRARRALSKQDFDVVYGYEMHGVLAVRLLRLFGFVGDAKIVSRFQGTWLAEMLRKRQGMRLLWNLDQVVALRSKSDLCIMTDDGTHGDFAYNRLNKGNEAKLRFWTNGTDQVESDLSYEEARRCLGVAADELVLLSVSRLEAWKRVDRNIEIAKALKERGIPFRYFVVGEGSMRDHLTRLAKEGNLHNEINFVGGIPHAQVQRYLSAADVFLSMYDLSNVGNPLLEAIRSRKIIVTLSNGDTSSWIKHKITGLIYDPQKANPNVIADDIISTLNDPSLLEKILISVDELSKKRLWTWSERMNAEIHEVSNLASQ